MRTIKLLIASIHFAFVFIVLFFSNQEMARSEMVTVNDHVVFVVDAHTRDSYSNQTDPLIQEADVIAQLKAQFPNSTYFIVSETSNRQIRESLQKITHNLEGPHPDFKVDCLYVLSHGAPLNIGNENGSFDVDLNKMDRVQDAFGPILGRFSEKAKVIIDGCETIDYGNNQMKFSAMKQIAENFGLKSGSIYMNKTVGSHAVSNFFSEPFYRVQNQKIITLIVQSLAVFFFPAYYLADHYLANQGYTLEIEHGKVILFNDDLFDAMKSPSVYGGYGKSVTPDGVFQGNDLGRGRLSE